MVQIAALPLVALSAGVAPERASGSILAKLVPASWEELSEQLAYLPSTSADTVRQGVVSEAEFDIFDGNKWTRLTAENW